MSSICNWTFFAAGGLGFAWSGSMPFTLLIPGVEGLLTLFPGEDLLGLGASSSLRPYCLRPIQG